MRFLESAPTAIDILCPSCYLRAGGILCPRAVFFSEPAPASLRRPFGCSSPSSESQVLAGLRYVQRVTSRNACGRPKFVLSAQRPTSDVQCSSAQLEDSTFDLEHREDQCYPSSKSLPWFDDET